MKFFSDLANGKAVDQKVLLGALGTIAITLTQVAPLLNELPGGVQPVQAQQVLVEKG